MALTVADIAAIKAYIGNDSPASSGLFSLDQIEKWTNPDVKYNDLAGVDQTVYTNTINDAYVYYVMYFGSTFSTDTAEQLSVLARIVLLIFMNWRNPDKHKLVREEVREIKRAKLRTQQITPTTVPFTEDSRNIDSSDTMYQGPSYENKL